MILLAEKKVEAKREAEAVKARKLVEERERRRTTQRQFLGPASFGRQPDRSGRKGHNELKGGLGVSGLGFCDSHTIWGRITGMRLRVALWGLEIAITRKRLFSFLERRKARKLCFLRKK